MKASDRILSRLENVRPRGADSWIARCPAHEDHCPSLTVRQIHDRVLVKCWASCTAAEICETLGLGLSDLFNSSRQTAPDPAAIRQRRIVLGFSKWRSDETLKAALALRSRDQWILAIAAAVDLKLITEAEATHWRAIQYDGYSALEWRFQTLLTGTDADALEVLRHAG